MARNMIMTIFSILVHMDIYHNMYNLIMLLFEEYSDNNRSLKKAEGSFV